MLLSKCRTGNAVGSHLDEGVRLEMKPQRIVRQQKAEGEGMGIEGRPYPPLYESKFKMMNITHKIISLCEIFYMFNLKECISSDRIWSHMHIRLVDKSGAM
jgi:hypothetical protein